MKRILVVGMLVVMTVVMALPAVALVANNTGLTPTGRSAEPSFGSAAKAEYNKKVCVKHFTGRKKAPKFRYISISQKAYEKHHQNHGDRIVSASRCQTS